KLYVLFYAADLDLEVHVAAADGPVWKDDSFTLSVFGENGKKHVVTVSVKGIVADGVCPADAASLGDSRCDLSWSTGARAAADVDGTINKLGDFDEEWNIQAAIPLNGFVGRAPKAGDEISIALTRCEISYDGPRSCGAWGTAAAPARLILD